MTLADLGVLVAGVALALAIPSRPSSWLAFMPASPNWYLLLWIALRWIAGGGLAVALVAGYRRARYGGPVRPAEWLAFGLASVALVGACPNLDEAVNAYYVAVGSQSLDFGVARWLLAAPAAVGVGLLAWGWIALRGRVGGGSRSASALAAVGTLLGLGLWFWGPCEVAGLELGPLIVPSPTGNPSTWGWRGSLFFGLRSLAAMGTLALTWGLMVAATIRSWRADRREGQARNWTWIEWSSATLATLAAGRLLVLAGLRGNGPGPVRDGLLLAAIGWLSWRITGLLGAGRGACSTEPDRAGRGAA